MPTLFKDAYEVLDYLAEKSGMFKMVRDEMVRLRDENELLKQEKQVLQDQLDTLALQILNIMGV